MDLLVKKEYEGYTEIKGGWSIEIFVEEEYQMSSHFHGQCFMNPR